MNSSSPRFSLPLIITGTLAAIFLILLVVIFQLLNAVQAENALLRQQIDFAELRIRSLQNEREAETILRTHKDQMKDEPSLAPQKSAQ